MHKYLLSAAAGVVGALALATTASAAVVCNEDGDCWRVKEKYDYRPDWGLTVYDDDWNGGRQVSLARPRGWARLLA